MIKQRLGGDNFMKITMDKRRVKNILHKITAYLLIACMIFGTNTMSVSATTDTTNSGINALTTGEPETGTNEGDIGTNEDVSPEGVVKMVQLKMADKNRILTKIHRT